MLTSILSFNSRHTYNKEMLQSLLPNPSVQGGPDPSGQGGLPPSTNKSSKVSYTSTELDNILIFLNDSSGFAGAINRLLELRVYHNSGLSRWIETTSTNKRESSSPSLIFALAHPSTQNTAYGQLVTLDKIVDKLIDKDLTDISDLFNRIRGCLKIHENCEHAFYSTFETFPFAVFSFFKTP